MKRKFFAIIISSICFACGDTHDSKLVGGWSGSEKNGQFENVSKSWIQNRYKNGTYEILFMSVEDCETESHLETGKLWTRDGKFFELVKGDTIPTIYDYEIITDNGVRFKLKSSETTFHNSDYTFVDSKIERID